MSIKAIEDLIDRRVLNSEMITQFVDPDSGGANLRFESEYWDYKRELFDIEDPTAIAELAADILAFHNTKGGYIIFGITNEFAVLGCDEGTAHRIDSNKLNAKIQKYVAGAFYPIYSPILVSCGGTRKIIPVIFIPPRKGPAVRVRCNAPGEPPLFKKSEIFLRVGDQRKRALSNADMAFAAAPPSDVLVGSRQVGVEVVRPGFTLLKGDYATFFGDVTRAPLIKETIEQILFDKWDVVLLRGVGGVGKTALAIEVTRQLALNAEYQGAFGGMISLSTKSEELSPYAIRGIEKRIASYDDFLTEILGNLPSSAEIPENSDEKAKLLGTLLRKHNVLLMVDNFETLDSRESRITKFLKNLPAGTKTLLTSRRIPLQLPVLDLEVPPLDREEAKALALAEARQQRVDDGITSRYLDQILEISSRLPLAIKWIISCSKNPNHLVQLIEEYRRSKPTPNNLCEFCFTFEYNSLSPQAKTALALMPVFDSFPTTQELAIAADLKEDSMAVAIEELENFSLVYRRFSATRDDDVLEILPLTKSFARTKLRELGELDRFARRRLKSYYGASIPELLKAAEEMVSRGATAVARVFVDDEILEREPDNPKALYLKGQTYEKEEQYTSALHEYKRALAGAKDDVEAQIEITLHLVALSRYEPGLSKEDLVRLLTSTFDASGNVKIALELARALRMADKDSRAFQYYQKVFENREQVGPSDGEEAAMFLFLHYKERRGPKFALEFLKKTLKSFPESRTMLNWERKLMEDLGIISYKSEWKT